MRSIIKRKHYQAHTLVPFGVSQNYKKDNEMIKIY